MNEYLQVADEQNSLWLRHEKEVRVGLKRQSTVSRFRRQ